MIHHPTRFDPHNNPYTITDNLAGNKLTTILNEKLSNLSKSLLSSEDFLEILKISQYNPNDTIEHSIVNSINRIVTRILGVLEHNCNTILVDTSNKRVAIHKKYYTETDANFFDNFSKFDKEIKELLIVAEKSSSDIRLSIVQATNSFKKVLEYSVRELDASETYEFLETLDDTLRLFLGSDLSCLLRVCSLYLEYDFDTVNSFLNSLVNISVTDGKNSVGGIIFACGDSFWSELLSNKDYLSIPIPVLINLLNATTC